MLSAEQNELLTRVSGDAPMGNMLRAHYWIPAAKSEAVKAGGAPVRVRLLGNNYVLFRTSEGEIGCLDERCPHRGVSLALARNEGCHLRCIFHGWAFDPKGKTIEVPTQSRAPEQFAQAVKVRAFAVRECGNLVWVWLGGGPSDQPPPFPDLEFTRLPAQNISIRIAEIPSNWFQGVEANQDSSHVGILHRNFVKGLGNLHLMATNTAPDYEVRRTRYGHQAAALRAMEDGTNYVRLTEFMMPWYSFVTPIDMDHSERILIIAVPADDNHMNLMYVRFDPQRPVDGDHYHQVLESPAQLQPIFGGLGNNWGQDRNAIELEGNHSGYHNLVLEDIAVQLSMGAIADRSKEQLCSGDRAVVSARQIALGTLADFLQGKPPESAYLERETYGAIRTVAAIVPKGVDWRTHFARATDGEHAEPALTPAAD